MTLWTSAEVEAATGGRATTPWAATGVSIDTRTIQPGDLFIALKDVRDGHDFVANALAKGAVAAMVSHIPTGLPADAPLVVVPDVLAALTALGAAARARSRARVVGVTGSVGKTSTKEMLRAVLSGQGKTHAAEASYNNQWGVPLTLARMPADTDLPISKAAISSLPRPDCASPTATSTSASASSPSSSRPMCRSRPISGACSMSGRAIRLRQGASATSSKTTCRKTMPQRR